MQCSYCNTPLPARAPFCPHCGTPTTPAASASTPYNAPRQGAPATTNGATPYMDFGPLQETSSASPNVAPPSSPVPPYQPQPALQPLPNQQQHMIFGSGSPQVYPQQGVPSQEQSYPAMPMPHPQQGMYPQGYVMPPGSVPQQQPRRSGLSTGVIVLLIVLVIAIIGGGGILLYATVLLPSSNHAQTTTATTSSKTPTVRATVPITTTNPQDLYTQVMDRTPTLNDPLSGPDNNNWQDFNTLQGCTFTGGVLHLHGTAGSCIGESTSFSDFAYQVKMTIIQGNVGGITFRFDAINRKFYFFALNPDGVYAVVYVGGSSANNEKLLASATSSIIIPGLNQSNMLTVIARGSSMNIYINRQFVTTITDSSSTIGSIGMLGGNSAGSTSDVVFSDAQVWSL